MKQTMRHKTFLVKRQLARENTCHKAHPAATFRRMDMQTIRAELLALNRAEFARLSGLSRRTLDRIAAGGHKPNATTMMAIETALKRWGRRAAK